jgi:hypothetical protein
MTLEVQPTHVRDRRRRPPSEPRACPQALEAELAAVLAVDPRARCGRRGSGDDRELQGVPGLRAAGGPDVLDGSTASAVDAEVATFERRLDDPESRPEAPVGAALVRLKDGVVRRDRLRNACRQ